MKEKILGIDKMNTEEISKRGQYDYNTYKLDDLEELILKPHKKGLKSLTLEEIEKYLEINDEMLKKVKAKETIVMVCKDTQAFIKEHKKDILNVIKGKEKENDGEER